MKHTTPSSKRLYAEFSNESRSPPQALEEDNKEFDSSAAADCILTTGVNITSIPTDLLENMLSYLTVNELQSSIVCTCKFFNRSVRDEMSGLWKTYCEMTGKISYCDTFYEIDKNDERFYYKLYYSIPCIPIDFDTFSKVNEYIEIRQRDNILDLEDDTMANDIIVTVMPGLYYEDIKVQGIRVKYEAFNNKENVCSVSIIWHYKKLSEKICPGENQPAIWVKSVGGVVSRANFRGFNIMHSSAGRDIWVGNCAVYCHGDQAVAGFERCNIQSSSGRGIVCTGGASTYIKCSNVHRSAATGIYVGDLGSYGEVIESHVILNGYGNVDSVPPGHSGVYIENAEVLIRDCLVSSNSLTALSVVRSGVASLIGCDCTLNGAVHPVTVDDNGDEHNAGILRGSDLHSSSDNSVVRDFVTNNFRPLKYHAVDQNSTTDEIVTGLAYGGRIRPRVPKILLDEVNHIASQYF